MNLPFGLPIVKETNIRRKDVSSAVVVQYERKLAEYKEVLENYKNYMKEYSSRLEGYERKFKDNQLANVQTAIDMTYLKEQGDKTVELLYTLKAGTSNRTVIGLDTITDALADIHIKLETLSKHMNALDEKINHADKNLLTTAINIGTMDKSMETVVSNMEGLDKNVVNRLSELLLELQKQTVYQNRQLQTELITDMQKINQTVKKGRTLLWFILIFNFFGICSIAFLVMYYLEVIPFNF